MSGTGLLLLIMLLINRYKKYILKLSIFIFFIILFFSYYFEEFIISFLDRLVSKVGLDYINILIDLKFQSIITEYKNLNTLELMIGNPEGFRGGDFGLLAFVLSNGFLGLIIFVIIMLIFINKFNAFPIILLMLSTLHYPVMFFLPGQIIFGLLLSKTNLKS